MTRPPFSALKLPLVLVLAALLLTSVSIWWGGSHAASAAAELKSRQQSLDAARRKLDSSRQQQQLIATHLAAYRALVARGFVGAEDRLAWIEAAQLANRDVGLYGLDYRLAPRTTAPPSLADDLPLGQTTMTLAMPLLVETDLPRFLAALKLRAPGVVRVEGCRLTRREDVPFAAANRPTLQAECELLWFTVTATARRQDA
jgi:hypothetical protein